MNLTIYWPCAEYTKNDGTADRISTYNGMLQLEDAISQIYMWHNLYHYDITDAWVDAYQKGLKVDHILLPQVLRSLKTVGNGDILIDEVKS